MTCLINNLIKLLKIKVKIEILLINKLVSSIRKLRIKMKVLNIANQYHHNQKKDPLLLIIQKKIMKLKIIFLQLIINKAMK